NVFAVFWFALLYNCRVPGFPDTNPTFSTVRRTHGLADTKPQVAHPVGRVGCAQVRKVWAKAHLEIDDLNARVAGRGQGIAPTSDSGNMSLNSCSLAAELYSLLPFFSDVQKLTC